MTKPEPLVEGRDYNLDEHFHYVLTREFLLSRGECCGSQCRNCPWREEPGVKAGELSTHAAAQTPTLKS